MSITNLSLVNQKLAFANANLADMDASIDTLMGAQKIKQQALRDAVIFHLSTALHFYIRELADQYRVKSSLTLNSIDDLCAALDDSGLNSSEANEVKMLMQTAGNWLYLLVRSEKLIFSSPEKVREKKAFSSSHDAVELISVKEINHQDGADVTKETLEAWVINFRDLIARHRITYSEY